MIKTANILTKHSQSHDFIKRWSNITISSIFYIKPIDKMNYQIKPRALLTKKNLFY
jgi:hypothetical protein